MRYNLMFSIIGMILTSMMLITYFMKRRKKTIQSRFYVGLIISSMMYALFDIFTIFMLSHFSVGSNFLRIFWNIRNSLLYLYVFIFGWYFSSLINKYEYKNFSTFFKKSGNLVSLVLIVFILVFSIIGGKFPGFTLEKLDFTGGNGFSSTIIITLVGTFVGLYYGIKNRKERKYIFNSFALILALLLITFFFQLTFSHISFMPFNTMIVILILYYNIENPDIALLEEVSILKNKIDKSGNAKTDFLFNLSYDLINPMNAIISLSQSLKSLSIDDKDEIYRDLKSIKYAGNALLDSIDNILDLSEMYGDENRLIEKEYSVYDLLKRMETVAIARIGAKQITFEMNIDDNISSRLIGDITKIQKVLLNIITNACKYSEIGKIILTVNATNDKDIQTLHFKISDTGIGIKKEELQFIFDGEQESSGMGLALSKKYIDVMNANVRVESVYGAGTVFYLDIPQKIVGERLISADKKDDVSDDVIGFIDCSKYKVLICDDDILDIKVTKKLLEKYKFQITTISSTMECIDRIKGEEVYDMLFLDHKMPDIDGIQTMKILKSLDEYNIPKIVALTANAVTGAREFYLREGFDDYLSKPIDIHELDKIIKRNFNK